MYACLPTHRCQFECYKICMWVWNEHNNFDHHQKKEFALKNLLRGFQLDLNTHVLTDTFKVR